MIITSLELSRNQIDDKTIKYFFDCLKKNETLAYIDLSLVFFFFLSE